MEIKDVFIVMPFDEQHLKTADGIRTYDKQHLDDVYTILGDAVRDYRSTINVDRMEQPYGNLVTAIINRLSSSDVVLAVLAGKNPNVFYELGIRHSLKLNTIMLVEHWDEYPFDLKSYFSCKYSIDSEPARRHLKEFIKTQLNKIETDGSLPDSPVIDVLKLAEFEQQKVINAWEVRKAAVILEGIIKEVIGVVSLFPSCTEVVTNIFQTKDTSKVSKIALSWDVIDGFTKNRPIPGLSLDAYADSENIYRKWRWFESVWNQVVDAGCDTKMMLGIVADTDRYTIGYAYDLVVACKYLMQNRLAVRIPWGNSMDNVKLLINDLEMLQQAREQVLTLLFETMKQFHTFVANFSGVPDSTLTSVESQNQDAPSFSDIIKSKGSVKTKKRVDKGKKKPRETK